MRLLRLSLSLIGSIGAATALAQEGPTEWRCWNNLDTRVGCVLRSAPAAAPATIQEQLGVCEHGPVTRPARLGPTNLPPLVRVLRQRPGALRGQIVLVPLHSEPFDQSEVAKLVQAVMYGTRSQCVAHYAARPAASLPEAMELADANDPLLAALD
jgi:hypothetical protein